MNNKIVVIGDMAAPYHPLSNIFALSDILKDYDLTFTDDYGYFKRLDEFCLTICYTDCWEQILSAPQAASLKLYLNGGGNLLNIHNGLSLQKTPELVDVFGAGFDHHPPSEMLTIKKLSDHPIMEGVADFRIFEEPYHYKIYGHLNVLAIYDFYGKSIPAVWESTYGKGVIIYIMPGHDKSAFECANYRRLITNSVIYMRSTSTDESQRTCLPLI